jgi:hypothetical protein
MGVASHRVSQSKVSAKIELTIDEEILNISLTDDLKLQQTMSWSIQHLE